MTGKGFTGQVHRQKARMVDLERIASARATAVQPVDLDKISRIFKALSDPTRLGIVMTLRTGEMCVCDLAAALNLTESAVSHQLRKLRDLSLVKNRRSGPIFYYSLDDNHVEKLLNIGLEHIRES